MKLLQSPNLTRTGLQLAADGIWEAAVSVNRATEDWLENAGPDIAIEVIFTDTSDALAGFIGFRRVIKDQKERRTFWRAVLLQTLTYQHDHPAEQVALWLDILKCPKTLNMPPNTMELGVFNRWKSAGTIAQTSERWVPPQVFDAPDWLHDGAEAPICREYVWGGIADGFWVADLVSEKVKGRYFLLAD